MSKHPLIYTPNTKALTIRSVKDKVIILLDGKLIATLPWEAAKQLSEAIKVQALLSEEYANADKVALDQAMMVRAGFPFGIANNPEIQRLSAHKAQYDDKARQVPLRGVKGKGIVGTPGLIRGESKDG